MAPVLGLRSAIILLVLAAIAPAFAVIVVVAFLEPAATQMHLLAWAVALIAALAVALAWAFSSAVLLLPIRRLLAQVDLLAREELDLSQAPEPSAVSEFGLLQQHFHEMSRQLAVRAIQRDGAMAEMEHQRNLFESVLEGMSEGVLVIDRRGSIMHANGAARRLLPGLAAPFGRGRMPSLESVHLGIYELDGDTPCPPERRPSTLALQGTPVEHYRYRVRGPLAGGCELVIEGSARPIVLPGAQPTGAVIVFNDISGKYAAEQALKESEQRYRALFESTERHVEERTRELALANQELESFSYSVSHDLRAPLQVIDGFSRTLAARHADQLDGQAMHYLGRIRENTRRMSQLIDDLLGLARVTRVPLQAERFDLSAQAHRALDQLRQRFPERSVRAEIEEPLPCEGDPRLLAVVMENLVGNAWKFTSRTDDAVIRVGRRHEAGEEVFFVSDNGAGFEMAYADKLFKAFQRLHAMTEFEGTGIGLATVHRIVTRHGGRVWAEAAPGQGATFLFTLK